MSKIKKKYLAFDVYEQSEVDALITTTSGDIVSQIPTDFYTTGEVDSLITNVSGSIIKDHGDLTGLTDSDDHTQYHNDTRGDVRYYTKTELGATTSGHTSGADLIGIPIIEGATNTTLHEFANLFGSAGRATGGAVTDAGSETVNVAAGTGFIKATDDDTAELLSFDWPAVTAQAITTDTVRYVGVEYNGGSPQVTIRTTDNFDLDTDFVLAKVVNDGGSLHILNNPWWVTDGITNILERFKGQGHLVRDEHVGGLIINVTGTRSISVTAGTLWSLLNEFPITALDTNVPLVASHSATFDVDAGSSRGTITAAAGTPYSGLSAGDKFYITGTGDNDGYEKVYSIGGGGSVITTTTVIAGTDGVEAATVLYPTFEVYSYVAGVWGDTNEYRYPVTYWNDVSGAGVLTELGVGKFMNYWVYAEADDDEIALAYGQAEYANSASAEAEAPPSFISTHHSESAKLLGRILIKKNTDAAVLVQTVFTTQFTASLAADHGNLAGLADDDHTQYLNTTRGDARYYTETELNAGQLDNRYYTESEVDTISGSLSSEIDSDISTHASSADHDGRYYTETEVDTISGSIVAQIPEAGGLSWSIITTDTTAVDGNGYLINASGTNVTLTLPTSPSEGDTVGFCDFYNMATTNVITISGTGSNIEGAAEDLIINIDGAGATLVYTDNTRGWEIVSEIGNITNNTPAYVKVSDTKDAGANGGTFTTGAWRTRDINTEDNDDSSICSISSNQITLEAGTYQCNISCPAYAATACKSRLYNISDSAVTLIGTTGMAHPTNGGSIDNLIRGQFTIASQKIFEVQHVSGSTVADVGFGNPAGNSTVEVYTIAEFWRQ